MLLIGLMNINSYAPTRFNKKAPMTMLRESDLVELSELQIFSGCRAETVGTLLAGAFYQKFPEGVELAKTGESADFLHVVVTGRVELYASYLDRESTIDIIEPLH